MPATSKKQFLFMEAVKHGGIKKPGLSPQKAAEFTEGVSYKSLPNKKKPSKKNYGDSDIKAAQKMRGK